jgi:hypothetical protein
MKWFDVDWGEARGRRRQGFDSVEDGLMNDFNLARARNGHLYLYSGSLPILRIGKAYLPHITRLLACWEACKAVSICHRKDVEVPRSTLDQIEKLVTEEIR